MRRLIRRLTSIETLILYATLVAGAAVFSFPFLWMVSTSFKLSREMAADHLRIMPAAPRPRTRSPYIDTGEFHPIAAPDGIPGAVWEHAEPMLVARMTRAIGEWEARIGSHGVTPPVDADAFRTEMIEGLMSLAARRIRDVTRDAARRSVRDGAPETIEAAVTAIVDEGAQVLDAATLERVFDQCYRRFAVGACRVRTTDFRVRTWSEGGAWTVEGSGADLVSRTSMDGVVQEARLRFDRSGDRAAFRLDEPLPIPIRPDEVDRIYVSYRGDASWARLVFEVVRAGRLYRTDDVSNLAERNWVETQLRWPGGAGNPMARRTYLLLHHVGAAPRDSAPFLLRVRVEKNSPTGAWIDKILHHYRTVFRELPFGRYIATSVSLSLLNIVLMVFSCTLSAYAFARLRWPGRQMCFGLMLATMMIPPQVTMIPAFLIFKELGWYNSLLPLWLPAAFGSPFFIFLLRQFLKTIPNDLEDAARIDGCGFLRIYWHVMMPLVTPTIAIIAVYTFIGTWNNFMGPLIYVNDERLFPLALGLFKFSLRNGNDVGLLMAGSFVMTLPILILFCVVQRYFIQGITLTGMKG